jgi:CBS domain-containing protein
MRLDDLARRAAHEVREASREARFSVRAPGSRRPLLARPVVAVGAAAVALAVGLPLLFVIRPWGREVLEPGTTTTTQVPTTTTTPITASGKAPAADVDELVERLYSALNGMDNEAFQALSADGAWHSVYYTDGVNGSIQQSTPSSHLNLPTAGYRSVEVRGEPILSGSVVAVPVAYTYPEPDGVVTGFDVLVLAPTGNGGWLVGGAATFFAADGSTTDPAEARPVIEASSAAFNAKDLEGALATYAEDAILWDDLTDAGATHTGAVLREFLNDNLYFTVEFTGAPVFSGSFVILPSRHTIDATLHSYEGMYVFWIRDGEIALQAYGQEA